MSHSGRNTNSSETSAASFPKVPAPEISNAQFKVEAPIFRSDDALTAFSFEFVAKPEQAAAVPLFLPAAMQSGLEDIAGFAGSFVIVSDREARLITVITFWSGTEGRRGCERSVRRVRALLAPYLDRCLRAQNLHAHASMPQNRVAESSSIDTRFIAEEIIAEEANACLA